MAVAAVVWCCAMVYSVTYCTLFGYGRTAENLTFVLGFPDWIFWGVILPWGLCTIFSVWFGLWYMQDHELEEGLHIDELRESDDA